ncbi:MAG: outer membrane protein assembly factor BamA [Acidobacteriota bacterium]
MALIFVTPVHVGAQAAAYQGQPIKQIEYRGLRTLTADTLNFYLFDRRSTDDADLRLDLEALDAAVVKLWTRELIDDIVISVVPLEEGVRLLVEVVERPSLVSIDYVGIKRLGRSDISDRVDRERINLFEGQPLDLGELERLGSAIAEMYREKGYRFAQVNTNVEELTAGQVRVVVTIDEGDKVKIGDIEFEGNSVYSDWRLRLAMKKTDQSGIISRVLKRDIYNPANIEEDLESIRELYRKAGYKDVLIARPEIDVVARNPNAANVEDQRRRLAVTIPIEEGERWRLGEISIEGNEVFSDSILLRQFERPRGGWLRSKTIDTGVENIDKLYQSLGYIFSEVDTELREKNENTADLIIHVAEKDQFKIGRIDFDGNSKTRDKVLRREMLVQESTVMNMNALKNSLLKIRQLNYFALDEDEPIRFDFDTDEKTVDLVVKGEEADRTELQFGGGWSEFDGFFGQFSMRTTNFLGRGETVGVSVQIGGQRELFDLEYRIPWFLDRPQSLGIRAYRQRLDYGLDFNLDSRIDYEQNYSGASITYGRRLTPFQSLNLSYTFADIEDIESIFDVTGDLLTREFTYRSSSIRPFWVFNTLDSRFEPFRGLRLTGSFEYAGTFLGGDLDFIRPQVSATYFQPVSRRPLRSTFGFNFEAGYITALNDGELFPSQRYFLGGESSVRGFRRRSIRVRDEDGNLVRDEDGFPLGGDYFAQINAEYHILAGGPFRVVLFADAGGVFSEDQSIDFGALRYSAGVELRVLVPLFGAPLRFIYAVNLDELEDDEFEAFDFNIGASF